MDINNFSSLYKPDYFDPNCKLPEAEYCRQILLSENCFNPLIASLFSWNTGEFKLTEKKKESCHPLNKRSVKKLNEEYFNPLTEFRKAMKSGDVKNVIETLVVFYSNLFELREEREYICFLKFRGLYYSCQWFKNLSGSDFPQDLICNKEMLPEEMKFEVFLEKDESPQNMLQKLFDGRQNVKTLEITSLGFKNPFTQILRGEFDRDRNAFDDASDCLKDKEFILKWHSFKKSCDEAGQSAEMQEKQAQVNIGDLETTNKEPFEITEATKVYSLKIGDETDHLLKGIGSTSLCNLITNKKAKEGLTVDQVRNQSKLIEVKEAETNIIDDILSQKGLRDILNRIEDIDEKEKDTGELTEEEGIERDKLKEELGKATNQGKTKKVFTDIQAVKNKERESTQTAINRALKELQNQKINEYLDKNIDFKGSLFYYKGELFERTITK